MVGNTDGSRRALGIASVGYVDCLAMRHMRLPSPPAHHRLVEAPIFRVLCLSAPSRGASANRHPDRRSGFGAPVPRRTAVHQGTFSNEPLQDFVYLVGCGSWSQLTLNAVGSATPPACREPLVPWRPCGLQSARVCPSPALPVRVRCM